MIAVHSRPLPVLAAGYLKTQKRLVDSKGIHVFRLEPSGKLRDTDVLQFFGSASCATHYYKVEFDATRCCVQRVVNVPVNA